MDANNPQEELKRLQEKYWVGTPQEKAELQAYVKSLEKDDPKRYEELNTQLKLINGVEIFRGMLTKQPPHKEQHDRMLRWYQLTKEIHDGRPHTQNTSYYQDVYLAFFMNCFHLKDWIDNDKTIKLKLNVEEFVKSTPCLLLCGDICNKTKHLELDENKGKRGRTGLDPKVGPTKYSMTLGEMPQEIQIEYTIALNNGEKKGAFELATECVNAWQQYIENYITPTKHSESGAATGPA